MRGPNNIASDTAVRDRLRRTPSDNAFRREAKRLAKDDNDLLGALEMLKQAGDIRQEHIDAHKRWLDQQIDAEDLA